MHVMMLTIRHVGGGAEVAVGSLTPYLQERGARVTRVAIDPPLDGEPTQAGPVLCPSVSRQASRIAKAAYRLAKILQSSQPDVLHAHCDAPELVTAMVASRGLPDATRVVVTDHSRSAFPGKRSCGNLARLALVARHARYYSCFPPGGAPVDGLLRPYREHIPNPIRTLAPLASAGDKPRLVVLSRLNEKKHVGELLHRTRSCWPGEVLVVGDGPELGRLKREHGERVDFMGYSDQPWHYVRKNDVYVSHSSLEGEPLAAIEAAHFNLPLLLRKNGAHEALFPGHPGLYAGDQLESAVSDLWADSGAFRLEPNLREQVVQERQPEVLADRWMGVYSRD